MFLCHLTGIVSHNFSKRHQWAILQKIHILNEDLVSLTWYVYELNFSWISSGRSRSRPTNFNSMNDPFGTMITSRLRKLTVRFPLLTTFSNYWGFCTWKSIDCFNKYKVSTSGNVRNRSTLRLMNLTDTGLTMTGRISNESARFG